MLLDEARKLCRTYFKSGDFSYQIVITPGGRRNRNQLNVDVVKKDGLGYTVLNRLSMYYDPEYPFRMQSSMDQAAYQADGTIKEYQIVPSENGFIGLYGQLEAQGSYFPLDDLFMPEFFSRPLNETDLIGMTVADMKILRNQYYAVHGRIFEKQELRDYFQEKTWYLGDKTEDEFEETVFGGLEKRNIAFLKKAEAEFDEEKSKEVKKIYDGLLTAPYASLLTAHTEMGVSLYSDIQHRADKGIYYEAEGTIYTPVILSPKQYEAVMKEGKEERICVNELTKETAAVRRTDNSDYGDCMLFMILVQNQEKHRERIRPITIFCPMSLIQEIIRCGRIATIRCLKIFIKVRSMCSRERNMSGINILVSRIKRIWKAAKE